MCAQYSSVLKADLKGGLATQDGKEELIRQEASQHICLVIHLTSIHLQRHKPLFHTQLGQRSSVVIHLPAEVYAHLVA